MAPEVPAAGEPSWADIRVTGTVAKRPKSAASEMRSARRDMSGSFREVLRHRCRLTCGVAYLSFIQITAILYRSKEELDRGDRLIDLGDRPGAGHEQPKL